jgi:hypothetical protein
MEHVPSGTPNSFNPPLSHSDPSLLSRFSLVPEEQRSRPHPQPSGDHASGEQGAGGIISNVFQGISRFFLGGEDQHHEPEHAHSEPQRMEGNQEAARRESASERPPGSFPRAVSPTVDEHPDQAVHDSSNRTDGSAGFGSTSGAQGPTDERLSARPSSTDNRPAQSETPPGNTVDGFASSADQRNGSLLGNSNTASSPTENRGSGDSSAERQGSCSAGPQDGAEHELDSSRSRPSPSPDTNPVNQSNHESGPNEIVTTRHHSPHPIYPTLIPAEHLQRHARREAELREAEARRQQTDGSAGDQGLSE